MLAVAGRSLAAARVARCGRWPGFLGELVLPLRAPGSGRLEYPAGSVVVQAEDREPCPVDGAGPGVKVGRDAAQSPGAGFAPAPGPAGEVGDLALDERAVRPVAVLPGGITLGGAGFLQDVLVRVDGDGPPAAGAGAGRAQRAGGAPGPERGLAAAAGGSGDHGHLPGRAGHRAALQIDGEPVLGEPPGPVAGRRAPGGDGEPLGLQVRAGGGVAVGRIADNIRLVTGAGQLAE